MEEIDTSSPEWMLQCEARFWMREIKKRGRKGRAWWNDRKDALQRKRGIAGLERLVREMNRQRIEANNSLNKVNNNGIIGRR